jgi:membrane-bound ClpP family serine protease
LTVIDEIKGKTNAKTLLLLINSPGGLVQSSYKVARALRKNFKKIIVFVPHVAASGGTLISLTGNQIVMGMMSQLTPLDPHSRSEEGKPISANSVIDAHAFVTEFFKDKEVSDAPYTYRVLADKFDPVEIRDALADLSLMVEYICEILSYSGYSSEKCIEVAEKMVKGFKTHGDVINIDKAKKIGLHVIPDEKFPEEWQIFREWLGNYMLESADKTHNTVYVFARFKNE